MARKTRVLFVDDDVNLLKASRRLLRKEIDLEIASGGEEALRLLRRSEPFDVLISDQNMPGMRGIAFLAETAKHWPLTVRIMLTGNDDQDTAISAVNEGRVFRFVRKPCQPEALLAAIRDAAKQHALLTAEKTLLESTLSGSIKVLTDVLTLTKPEIYRKALKVQKWARNLAPHLNLPHPWELNLAAMLYPLGMLAMPDDIAARFHAGEPLTDEEHAMISRAPRTARDLVQNIPRMENIARAIYYSRKGFDGSGFPPEDIKGEDLPMEARLLRILIDLVDVVHDSNAPLIEGLKVLAGRAHLYDVNILQVTTKILIRDATAANQIQTFEKLMPEKLVEGDMVIKPIMDKNQRILLNSGTELTSVIIRRLRLMQESGAIVNPIHISRWKEAA